MTRLTSIGLFAGIGGVEEGFRRAGIVPQLFCEIDPHAQAILHRHFPEVELHADIRNLSAIPTVDVVTAGFPCQDLSQVGTRKGIRGGNSGLVFEGFRLLRKCARPPNWIFLENVPFMLRLDRGRAMSLIIRQLDELGYCWAYRCVDAFSFGRSQRRPRVLLVASRDHDPRAVLLTDQVSCLTTNPKKAETACGFYWTEGNRGLGWAVDAVPPLKGGSALGIASPPAIWLPRQRRLLTPHICDAERLQGFPQNWTRSKIGFFKKGARWRLIGNAVSVPVANWLAKKIQKHGTYVPAEDTKILRGEPWPAAAWGYKGSVYKADVTAFPVERRPKHLAEFLRFCPQDLSARATAGFISRLEQSALRFDRNFLGDAKYHLRRMTRLEGRH
jgi:DNA (cytosine-5)-methyltransferase 1